MIVRFYIFLFFMLIDNTAWLSKIEFTRFANVVCNIFVIVINLIALIIMTPLVLLELFFGTIIWLIHLAIYRKQYRKTFAQFFKLCDNDIELKGEDKNDVC